MQAGYRCEIALDGETAADKIETGRYDLILLDIMLPGVDGYELMEYVRPTGTPVIFLTAKGMLADRVRGLRMGADDYIKKPFSQHLLIARIKTLLRRLDVQNAPDGENKEEDALIERGDLLMDKTRHSCTWKGKPLDLTITEFLILYALVEKPGFVKTRDQLIDVAYGSNVYVDDRTVDSHIKRLRRKFKEIDDSFARIETLYGVGYRYREG